MKTIDDQLSSYKSVHLNGKNVQTHFVGIDYVRFVIRCILTLNL